MSQFDKDYMINLQNCNLISPLIRENLLVNVKTEVWPENKKETKE